MTANELGWHYVAEAACSLPLWVRSKTRFALAPRRQWVPSTVWKCGTCSTAGASARAVGSSQPLGRVSSASAPAKGGQRVYEVVDREFLGRPDEFVSAARRILARLKAEPAAARRSKRGQGALRRSR